MVPLQSSLRSILGESLMKKKSSLRVYEVMFLFAVWLFFFLSTIVQKLIFMNLLGEVENGERKNPKFDMDRGMDSCNTCPVL